MTEKNFLIAAIVVLVIGAGVVGMITKFGQETAKPSPSPSVDNLLYNNSEGKNAGNVAGQTNQGQAVNPSQNTSQTNSKLNKYTQAPPVLPAADLKDKKAVIATAKGNIEFQIYPEASKAASNFIFLTQEGFYDNLTFHRVEPGFVIQGGDPSGNGTGGPGYRFEDEKVTRDYLKGTVAMANAGPNTNGSQFFIMLEDNLNLPKNYTIFGKVIKGQDVVSKITRGDVMTKVIIEPLK